MLFSKIFPRTGLGNNNFSSQYLDYKHLPLKLKNKIVKRYTLNDENLKDYKSTNINILLNRVRVNKKKEFQKKILFTAATSLGAVLFGVLIF